MASSEAQQFTLFDPDDEAAAYHSAERRGFFSLFVKYSATHHRQSNHELRHMPQVIQAVDKRFDTYITQAEFFKPSRLVVNVARLGLLFADLDTYKMPWAAGRSPEQLATSVLHFCEEEGIPAPSIMVYSGRGIQAKWLLDSPLPRQALVRWNACQRYLVDRLAAAGSDPQAKDAARVLRLVNTVNNKSGEVCRVVHVEVGPDGDPIRYNFEKLAEILLPVARWTIEKQRKDRADKRQLKLLDGTKTDNLRGFSGRQLAWHRLEDLRTLANLRGGVKDQEHMMHLFWRLNFLLLSGATNSRQMYREAAELAQEIEPTWNYRSKELMTLYAKAKAFEAGEKVSFCGRELPPLYTPKNDTLISLFKITDAEQRHLRTIISKDMAADRHKERQKARRRASGAVERETYLDAAHNRRLAAQALKTEGLSVREIAKRLGVSVGSVSGYLKAAESVQSPCVLQAETDKNEGCSKSVRTTNGEASAPRGAVNE